ncbi:MAG: hypothetical protein J1F40_07225 [Prevotellaceae bacterium]|nr:hypothetical protein [Prevotellaceae bacterium]
MKKIYCMLLIASVVSIVAPIRVVAQTDLTNTYVTITDDYEEYNIEGFTGEGDSDSYGNINKGEGLSLKWRNQYIYYVIESFEWKEKGYVMSLNGRLALCNVDGDSPWWGIRNPSGNSKGGLINRVGNAVRPMALLNLFQGDKVTIWFDNGGNEIVALANNKKLTTGEAYTVMQDGHLELEVANNVYIRKIRIDYDKDSRDVAKYEVDEDKGTFRFTSGGVLKNRTIKEVPHMEMRFGNTELPNKTVISKFGDGDDCWGATVKDQYNNGWLWSADPNNYNGDYKGDYETGHYYQGTFYVFKPSLDGELEINGYNDKGGPCEFSHYYRKDFEENLLKIQGKCTLKRKVKAGYMYIFHATPYPGGDLNYNIFHLTSFKFTPTVDFKKPYVVIKDGSTSYTFQQFPKGTGTTFYVRTEGDITQADLDEDNGVLKWSGNGGAIIVTAVHTDIDANDEEVKSTAYCVITVPYAENKEWDFSKTETKEELNLNTTVIDDKGNVVVSNTDEWALDWKVYRHEEKDDDGPAGNNKGKAEYYTELERPVFSNSVDVTGDNARFIDKTAGLLFFSPIKCFGTNISDIASYYKVTEWDEEGKEKAREWGYDGKTKWMSVAEISEFLKQTHANYDLSDEYVDNDMMGESITMEVGSKMVIPNLKKGQHIRIRWDRHFWNNGELMMAENVTDLEGKSMNRKLFYVGAGSVNVVYGHHEFIVEEDNQDVAFTLVDNGDITIKDKDGKDKTITVSGQQGWVNIKNIKIGPLPDKDPNFYFDTHMTPTLVADTESAQRNNLKIFPDKNVKESSTDYKRDAIYTFLRKKTDNINTELSISKNDLHTQNGRQDDKYHILGDKDYEHEKWGNDSRTGTLGKSNCYVENDQNLTITDNAHGSFTLVLESRHSTIGNEKDAKTPFYCYEDFLLDSCHVKVSVYEYDYNVKPYPYTWAMEHFTTTTGNNTKDEIAKDANREIVNADNEWRYWDFVENVGNNEYDPVYRFRVGNPENMIAWKKRTDTRFSGDVTYKMKSGEKMVSGQRIPVKNGNEVVATLTFGERGGNPFSTTNSSFGEYPTRTDGNGENGNQTGGTFYTIIPKYDGTINVAIEINTDKTLYVYKNDKELLSKSDWSQKSNMISFDVKEGQHYKIYAYGSRLGFYGLNYKYDMTGDIYIPEFDGLGIMPTEYWNEKDEGLQLRPFQNGLVFGEKGYSLKVPNVQEGQTLYIAVTGGNPSVTVDGTSVNFSNDGFVYEDGYGYVDEIPLKIYKVEGKGGDIDLNLANLTLHKMAVSVDSKDVYCDTGYATEAREYPIDITLANLFLGKKQRAYKVTGVDDDQVNVTMQEVHFVPMTIDGSTSENNGIVVDGTFTKFETEDKESWPLFTTDIDRETDDMSGNLLIGVVAQANIAKVDQGEKDEKDENKTYYNYMLANRGYNVKYDSEEDAKDPTKPGDATGLTGYGVGFYLVLKEGTTFPDGTTYDGGKPKDHSAYMKLGDWLAKQNPIKEQSGKRRVNVNAAGIHQVFFIDVDSLSTGIDEVLTDDELPTTGDNPNVLNNGVFYTLQGVPVKNPTKGIYIFNGKKVYVK